MSCLVMDGRFFILSLILVGLLSLFGSIAIPLIGTVYLTINSRSKPTEIHTVIVDEENKRVYCDCEGYRYHKRCGHIKFYKKLIKRLIP